MAQFNPSQQRLQLPRKTEMIRNEYAANEALSVSTLRSVPAWQKPSRRAGVAPKRELRMPKHSAPIRINGAGALVLGSAMAVVSAVARAFA